MALNETVSAGVEGHISDHRVIHTHVNAWDGYGPSDFGRQLAAVRTTTAARVNDTTLVADDVLAVPVIASKNYLFELVLFYDADVAGDLKFSFSIPSGAAIDYVWDGPGGDSTGHSQAGDTQTADGSGTGSYKTVRVKGVLRVATTAGTFALTWGQGTSSAVASRLTAGSMICVREIG